MQYVGFAKTKHWAQYLLSIFLIVFILYWVKTHNYLLFHSMAEAFSIVIACAIFMISWNVRYLVKNPYLVYLGIAYLFIGILDFFHLLAYEGMNVFVGYDDCATQLWIGTRYVESLTLLVFFVLVGTNRKMVYQAVFIFYALLTASILLAIFYWQLFPVCFVPATGLTAFKLVSEYVICAILFLSLIALYRNREAFDPGIRALLFWATLLTILGELAFTFYVSSYGFSNLVGHYLKIGSFYLLYKAIIETGINNPFDLIFLEIDQANRHLRKEIASREETEQAREKALAELKMAFNEIKTLRGIIPICMHCKSIRDDKGYWKKIELYVREHSHAEFSHSLCPVCAEKHYPDYLPR